MIQMKKYGLQPRVPASQQKKSPKPPLHLPIFSTDGDDDEDINGEIARQATKNKVLRDVEEQHKKALEEDPSAFDYDGFYEKKNEASVRPRIQKREQKESKYIHTLRENNNERNRQREIVFERKLAKERTKDEHLFADKEKFVTSAYKKKLAERAKWSEEERIRQLREEKDDVTKKSDISDFYINLGKNVAFGAVLLKPWVESGEAVKKKVIADTSQKDASTVRKPASSSAGEKFGDPAGSSAPSDTTVDASNGKLVPTVGLKVSNVVPKPMADQSDQDPHKKRGAALSAAKERFLARKRAKHNSVSLFC